LTSFLDKGGIACIYITDGLMHISAEVGMFPEMFEIFLNGSDYVQFFLLFVYICIAVGEPIIKKEKWLASLQQI
jgi:hypothetical protein